MEEYWLRPRVRPFGTVKGRAPCLERRQLPTSTNWQACAPGTRARGAGYSSLLGNAGLRFNLKAIGRVQPRPGIGFVFPMNSGARQETAWGVIASLVFQF